MKLDGWHRIWQKCSMKNTVQQKKKSMYGDVHFMGKYQKHFKMMIRVV